MKKLLVDIGNSRIKKALWYNDKLSSISKNFYNKNNFSIDFDRFISSHLASVDEVYISCNNKLYNKLISDFFRHKYPDLSSRFLSRKMKLPFEINYTNSLGIDRICSVAGAIYLYKSKNILVIDSGTATTINLLKNNIYEGGMITAGLKTIFDSLKTNTTLPGVNKNFKLNLISKNTKDAIASGVYFQQIFFINSSIISINKHTKNLLVIGTGGGMNLLKDKINNLNYFEENLVLYGMMYIAQINEKKYEDIRKK